eukprot:TRINITY_DN19224_c0_g1_i2.p1 TRINITY_DN19224_c0_g1~~TRINITY_DN19224_c0_g1_i2.p1  ORF type:complete len:575 (+),score=135.92 TRINITY_DN19224_c0_g1_i2:53-1726(+)
MSVAESTNGASQAAFDVQSSAETQSVQPEAPACPTAAFPTVVLCSAASAAVSPPIADGLQSSDVLLSEAVDNQLAGVRRNLMPEPELLAELEGILQQKPTWVRSAVLGLLAHEGDAAYQRVAENTYNFVRILQKYADLTDTSDSEAVRGQLKQLQETELVALERLACEISEDIESLPALDAEDHAVATEPVSGFARVPEDLCAGGKLKQRSADVRKQAMRCLQLADEFRVGRLAAEKKMAATIERRSLWRERFAMLADLEAKLHPAALRAVKASAIGVGGAFVLLAILGGVSNWIWLGTLSCGCTALQRFYERRFGSGVTYAIACRSFISLGNSLGTLTAALTAAIPALQLTLVASVVGLALLVLGGLGRQKVEELLNELWEKEAAEHEKARQAFSMMEKHLLEMQKLEDLADYMQSLEEALAVVRQRQGAAPQGPPASTLHAEDAASPADGADAATMVESTSFPPPPAHTVTSGGVKMSEGCAAREQAESNAFDMAREDVALPVLTPEEVKFTTSLEERTHDGEEALKESDMPDPPVWPLPADAFPTVMTCPTAWE